MSSCGAKVGDVRRPFIFLQRQGGSPWGSPNKNSCRMFEIVDTISEPLRHLILDEFFRSTSPNPCAISSWTKFFDRHLRTLAPLHFGRVLLINISETMCHFILEAFFRSTCPNPCAISFRRKNSGNISEPWRQVPSKGPWTLGAPKLQNHEENDEERQHQIG